MWPCHLCWHVSAIEACCFVCDSVDTVLMANCPENKKVESSASWAGMGAHPNAVIDLEVEAGRAARRVPEREEGLHGLQQAADFVC